MDARIGLSALLWLWGEIGDTFPVARLTSTDHQLLRRWAEN